MKSTKGVCSRHFLAPMGECRAFTPFLPTRRWGWTTAGPCWTLGGFPHGRFAWSVHATAPGVLRCCSKPRETGRVALTRDAKTMMVVGQPAFSSSATARPAILVMCHGVPRYVEETPVARGGFDGKKLLRRSREQPFDAPNARILFRCLTWRTQQPRSVAAAGTPI